VWKEKKTKGEDSIGTQKRGLMEDGLGDALDAKLANSATSPLKTVQASEKEEVANNTRRQLIVSMSGASSAVIPPPPP
jgi:hypothetical protein